MKTAGRASASIVATLSVFVLVVAFAVGCNKAPVVKTPVGEGAHRILENFAWLPVPVERPEPLVGIRTTARERGAVEVVFLQHDINVVLCAGPPDGPALVPGFCEADGSTVLRDETVAGAEVKLVLIRLQGPTAEKVSPHVSEGELEAITSFWKKVSLASAPAWLAEAAGA
jgi:hypothetical protein